MARLLIFTFASMLAAILTYARPLVARGETLVVTKTADTNDGRCNDDCSLREAVATANKMSTDRIIHLPIGTYALDGGPLEIHRSMEIAGGGEPRDTIIALSQEIDEIDAHRLVTLRSDAIAVFVNLTLQGGKAGQPGGGAIYVRGVLAHAVLVDCIVQGNVATGDGGAIYSNGAVSLIESTTVRNNVSESGRGGGIAISELGDLAAIDSTLSDNVAHGDGGGIFTEGALFLDTSTVHNNTSSGNGGGIAILSSGDRVVSSSSGIVTISGNTADGNGGGIFSSEGNLVLDGFEISANESKTGHGGGVYSSAGLQLSASTVGSNRSDGNGGGIYTGGDLELNASNRVTGNIAKEDGGGAYVVGRVVTDEESATTEFSNNRAGTVTRANGRGGGIAMLAAAGDPGVQVLRRVTVDGNCAVKSGGGIYTNRSLTIEDASVINNTVLSFTGDCPEGTLGGVVEAPADRGGGGGIYVDAVGPGALRLEDSTVSDNQSISSDGGGIFSKGGVEASASRIDGNQAGACGYCTRSDVTGERLNPKRGFLCREDDDCDFTIRNNHFDGTCGTRGMRGDGGGIYAGEGVKLKSLPSLSTNSATNGGGTYALGTISLDASTVAGNCAFQRVQRETPSRSNTDCAEPIGANDSLEEVVSSGGGLYSAGGLIARRSRFLRNDSKNYGGGIFVADTEPAQDSECPARPIPRSAAGDPWLILDATSIVENSASQGAGLFLDLKGPSTIERSTLSGNTADDRGGAIYIRSTRLLDAERPLSLELNRVTIASNEAGRSAEDSGGKGGGIYSCLSDSVGMINTIVALNSDLSTAEEDESCHDIAGPDGGGHIISRGYNLIQNPYCQPACDHGDLDCLVRDADPANTDMYYEDPVLTPLRETTVSQCVGGTDDGSICTDTASCGGDGECSEIVTDVHYPLASSRAIDHGTAEGDCPPDQRGVEPTVVGEDPTGHPRICDIGACERTCDDGVIDAGEECDGGDGCDLGCQIARCWATHCQVAGVSDGRPCRSDAECGGTCSGNGAPCASNTDCADETSECEGAGACMLGPVPRSEQRACDDADVCSETSHCDAGACRADGAAPEAHRVRLKVDMGASRQKLLLRARFVAEPEDVMLGLCDSVPCTGDRLCEDLGLGTCEVIGGTCSMRRACNVDNDCPGGAQCGTHAHLLFVNDAVASGPCEHRDPFTDQPLSPCPFYRMPLDLEAACVEALFSQEGSGACMRETNSVSMRLRRRPNGMITLKARLTGVEFACAGCDGQKIAVTLLLGDRARTGECKTALDVECKIPSVGNRLKCRSA